MRIFIFLSVLCTNFLVLQAGETFSGCWGSLKNSYKSAKLYYGRSPELTACCKIVAPVTAASCVYVCSQCCHPACAVTPVIATLYLAHNLVRSPITKQPSKQKDL